MSARRWTLVTWTLLGLAAGVLLLKSFVADVYRVDSGSMRPTLFGGRARADAAEDDERVLVLYGRGFEPERFDLVVIRSPDGTKPLVKRVVGLPHDEDLAIRGGDLFVGRERLPPDAPRPPLVVVYDDRHQDPLQYFERRRDGSVRREGAEWVVAGGTQPPGSLLHYKVHLRDDYLDREHRRVPGVVEVNDAALALEFRLDSREAGQKLRFQLVEEGDTFELVLETDAEAGCAAVLVRRTVRTLQERRDLDGGALPSGEIVLARAPVALEEGRWCDLWFENVDNHLRARSRALSLEIVHAYAENEPWPAPLPPGQTTIGTARVRFGAERGTARFRAVRVLRDLYYTDDGVYGVSPPAREPSGRPVQSPISLGPDEYFLLGDNSAASTDSRHFGPIPAAALVGRPLAVVWPDPRWLHPVAER